MILDYGLILDGLIVVLLLATIVYAAQLNRRIGRLRDGRAELERAARGFAEAAARAEAGVKALRQAADGPGKQMRAEIDKALVLRDELAFLVETGEGLADRLAGAASGAGARARRPVDRPAARPAAAEKDEERTRRDLMKVIENLR
ncbi:MAG: hypothetical protein HKM95_02990 [Inquilinus sp.]|nr:hypothetical protein [Inquilinus sp.]